MLASDCDLWVLSWVIDGSDGVKLSVEKLVIHAWPNEVGLRVD